MEPPIPIVMAVALGVSAASVRAETVDIDLRGREALNHA